MIDLIYAGVWLAGIVAVWDMVRTGCATLRERVQYEQAMHAKCRLLEADLKELREQQLRASSIMVDFEAAVAKASELRMPERLKACEEQIAAVRGMIPPVKRVGLGIR